MAKLLKTQITVCMILTTFSLIKIVDVIDVQKCEEKTLFYEDLLCDPIYETTQDECPHYFNCTKFDERPRHKCHFRGEYVSIGANLKSDIPKTYCQEECICKSSGEGLYFLCRMFECPDWINEPTPGCNFVYHARDCCASGEICPDREEAVRCVMGKHLYIEGMRYESAAKEDETCVCSKDRFGNGFNDCLKLACLVEIFYSDEIDNYCAIVYESKKNVCPASMYCPRGTEEIVHSKESDVQCRFGNKFLNIGDRFDHAEPKREIKLHCACRIPPFITCFETPYKRLTSPILGLEQELRGNKSITESRT